MKETGLLAQTEPGKQSVQQIIPGNFTKNFPEMGMGAGELHHKKIRFQPVFHGLSGCLQIVSGLVQQADLPL